MVGEITREKRIGNGQYCRALKIRIFYFGKEMEKRRNKYKSKLTNHRKYHNRVIRSGNRMERRWKRKPAEEGESGWREKSGGNLLAVDDKVGEGTRFAVEDLKLVDGGRKS